MADETEPNEQNQPPEETGHTPGGLKETAAIHHKHKAAESFTADEHG